MDLAFNNPRRLKCHYRKKKRTHLFVNVFLHWFDFFLFMCFPSFWLLYYFSVFIFPLSFCPFNLFFCPFPLYSLISLPSPSVNTYLVLMYGQQSNFNILSWFKHNLLFLQCSISLCFLDKNSLKDLSLFCSIRRNSLGSLETVIWFDAFSLNIVKEKKRKRNKKKKWKIYYQKEKTKKGIDPSSPSKKKKRLGNQRWEIAQNTSFPLFL